MTTTSRLGARLAQRGESERARAVRDLLVTPLLTATADPDAFDRVRRHRDWLVPFFAERCGWSLVVESRRGYARLAKVRDPDASRPARRTRGGGRRAFDRRRYSLLCVIAAELSRPGGVTTVGLLAERVRAATAADADLTTFDTAMRRERSAFVDALGLLERLGVVTATDGATEAFVESADAKVLYQVDAVLLARLLAAPVSPSALDTGPDEAHEGDSVIDAADDIAALLVEPRYGGAPTGEEDVPDATRNAWLRHSLTRRLLDDPVVHLDTLTDAQRAYLANPSGRRAILDAARAAGFLVEERAEGICAVDPDAVATDDTFPDERSHPKHAALLLLDALLGAGRALRRAEITEQVEALLGRFPSWAKRYQSDGGPGRLVDEALEILARFGLVEETADGIVARPVAWRYRIAETATDDATAPEHGPDDPDGATGEVAGQGRFALDLGGR